MALRLGEHLMSLHDRLLHEPLTKRVRCSLDGVPVCDTTTPSLVWETRRVVPMYAVPEADLVARLTPGQALPVPAQLPPLLGPVRFAMHLDPGETLDVHAGDHVAPAAAFRPADPDLRGLVVLEWAPFDWVEEDQPVTGHPHDVFKRIDTLPSSRRVQVSLGELLLADTTAAVALHETLIPTRWYLPRDDVRMDLLAPSASRTTCAYKGHASYFSLADGRPDGADIAWTYPDPLHDAAAVADRICFYSERTDLRIDGVALPRPTTPWSSPADQARS
jgi:uncharacterized protein (DUF427 family)